jgi:hypothetical protein
MNNDTDIEKIKLDLEQQKIQFERFKFDKEQEFQKNKLDKEQEFQKNKLHAEQKSERIKTIVTALSIIVPLIVIGLTINNNLDLQAKQARYDFTLKAAEIVMDAKTPLGTQHKALALQELFPNYLDHNFGKNFDPASYSISKSSIDQDEKEAFLQILIQNGNMSTKELVNWYVRLFPENDWIDQNGTIISSISQNKTLLGNLGNIIEPQPSDSLDAPYQSPRYSS